MTLQIDFWQLLGFLVSFLGVLWAVVKTGLSQAQRAHDATMNRLFSRLEGLEEASREEASADAANWQRVEREILQLKAELPLNYVRREDYVQAIATIMAKLDAMSMRFENILLRGAKNYE